MSTWTDIGQELLRNRPPCLVCGIRASDQLHHGLFGRRKRHSKYLDHVLNACPACHDCNVAHRTADTEEFRERFVVMQIEKFGLYTVQAWVTDFPVELQRGDEWKQLARLVGLNKEKPPPVGRG